MGVGLVLFALLPLVYDDAYYLTVIVTALIILTLNISWNFVLGMAGVWNFGQLAIYALGAYGAGLLMLHATWLPVAVDVLLGGLLAAAISVLLAIPTLRLFGIYTSLLTFAFSQVVQYVALNDPGGLTGGPFGFPTVPGLYPDLEPEAQLRAYYWTALGVAVLATAAVAWLRASPLGITLRSIRDAPAYTAARGANPLVARVTAFGISGFIAGIAGGLYICFNQSITANAMGLTPMSIDVTMLVIGGLGTIFGPILGTRPDGHPDVADRLSGHAADDPRRPAAGHRDLRARRPGGLDQPHGPPGAGVGGGVSVAFRVGGGGKRGEKGWGGGSGHDLGRRRLHHLGFSSYLPMPLFSEWDGARVTHWYDPTLRG